MRGLVRMAGFVGTALLMAVPGAHAQGCVLCYTSLAGAGPGAMRAFEMAMLTLLIPALLLFAGVFLFIFLRARESSSSTESAPMQNQKQKEVRRPRFTPAVVKPAEGRV